MLFRSHVDGYALFVKDALPGETIHAKIMKCNKKYGFARMMEVLECSSVMERIRIDLIAMYGREPHHPTRKCAHFHKVTLYNKLYRTSKERKANERIERNVCA